MTKTIDTVKAWLTPTLIVLIGYLFKGEFEEIKSQIKNINSIEVKVAVLENRVSSLERKGVTTKVFKNIPFKYIGKHENEITISNISSN